MDKRFKTCQYGQSDVFEKLCYPKGNESHTGIFVEIGAWDGVDISNSYWLEKCKNWSGLLVEPISSLVEQAKHNRWCNVWQGCVYDRDGEVNFLHIKGYSEMLSCIQEAAHSSHNERVEQEVLRHNQERETIKVPCKTLNSLLDSFGMKQVDILSLDVQSVELSVLKAYNMSKNPCKAILLDTNGLNQQELEDWFRDNGYKMHWKHPNADEYLFVNHELKWSWE